MLEDLREVLLHQFCLTLLFLDLARDSLRCDVAVYLGHGLNVAQLIDLLGDSVDVLHGRDFSHDELGRATVEQDVALLNLALLSV